MKTIAVRILLPILSVVLFARPVRACDLCALYTAMQVDSPVKGAVRLSASEQYTLFNRLRQDGHYIENAADQYLKSSVTQVSGQYDISDSLAAQFVAPIVSRSYRRIENEEVTNGIEAGIGDMSLLLHYLPIRYSDGNTTLRVRFFGGIELPTGDAHLLGEEGSEDTSVEHEAALKHGGEHHEEAEESEVPENAIHGHDLALGSGSFDFPFGVGVTTQWKRVLASADLQYTVRGDGAYSYRYANDFIWSSSVGSFLYIDDSAQVAARVRLSGQYKEKDTGSGGVSYDDTAANTKFIGPELNGTIGQTWQGVLGLDIPIDVKNSDLQITATYRWRAALTYRF